MSVRLMKRILLVPLMVALAAVSALGSLSGMASLEDVEQQIQAVRQRVQDVRRLVEDSRNSNAVELLEQGVQFLERAEQALEEAQDERQARNYLQRALELVNAATQEAARNRNIDQEKVERELIRLREVLLSTEEALERVNIRAALDLLERAKEEAEKAREIFEEGLYLGALEHVRRAMDLSDDARKLAFQNASITPTIAFDEIVSELQALQTEANTLLVNTDGIFIPANAEQILQNAETLKQRAEESFNTGRIEAALAQARRARELFQLIIRSLAQTPASDNAAEQAQRELDRARALQADAQNLQPPGPSAGDSLLLSQIESLIAQSEASLETGNVLLALQQALQASDLAIQLMHQYRYGNTTAEPLPEVSSAAQSEYRQLVGNVLPDALEQVRQSPTARAIEFLEKAQASAERADQFIQGEQFVQALREISISRTFARRATEESLRSRTP